MKSSIFIRNLILCIAHIILSFIRHHRRVRDDAVCTVQKLYLFIFKSSLDKIAYVITIGNTLELKMHGELVIWSPDWCVCTAPCPATLSSLQYRPVRDTLFSSSTTRIGPRIQGSIMIFHTVCMFPRRNTRYEDQATIRQIWSWVWHFLSLFHIYSCNTNDAAL